LKASNAVELVLTADELAATPAKKSRPSADPVARLLYEKDMVKSIRPDGALNIECPRQDQHTGDSTESASIYYPRNTGGFTLGNFKCLHAHCVAANRDDFLSALGYLPEDEKEDTGGKKNQATILVAFVLERYELFHNPEKDVYCRDRISSEVCLLNSRQLRDRVGADYYTATGNAAREQSLKEALGTLAGLGRFKGEMHDVSLRFAGADGVYVLDLAQPGSSRAVRLTPGKWEVVETPEHRFYRPESMQPLPIPTAGGSIDGLFRVVNVPEALRLLVITWLIECLRPDTPYPVMEIFGEQGCGKSVLQEILRRLIDPNACNLRSAPKSVEDLFVSAGVCAMVSCENISHLSAALQDVLCIIATGGGHAARALYTNKDEAIISVKRPVILNGISVSVTAQDLVDRCVTLELPRITDRLESNELWSSFNHELPYLLGALLDIAAKALEILPTIRIPAEQRPRLIEFARLGMAVSVALGKPAEEFLSQFNNSRQEALSRTIDASPVAAAIVDMIDATPGGMTAPVKEILHTLERYRPNGCEAWPRSPKGLGDAMRRAAPALRQIGIDCEYLGKGSGGVVRWSIKSRKATGEPQSTEPRPQVSLACDEATYEDLV